MPGMCFCAAAIRSSVVLCLLLVSTHIYAARSYHQPIEIDGMQLQPINEAFKVEHLSKGALKRNRHISLKLDRQGSTQQLLQIRPVSGHANTPIYAVLKMLKSQKKVSVKNQLGSTRHGDPIIRVDSSWAAGEAFSLKVQFEKNLKRRYFSSWNHRDYGSSFSSLKREDKQSCQADKQKVSYKIYFYHRALQPADQDFDGVPDPADQCANTPLNTAVDDEGCAIVATEDDDEDVDTGTGQDNNRPFVFSINTEGTYEIYAQQVLTHIPHYDVDCNSDGVLEGVGVSGNYVCSYPIPGHYTVSLYGDVVSFSTSPGVFSTAPSAHEVMSVEQWGDVAWKSMLAMFSRANNLQINAFDSPDMRSVEDMRFMFYRASSFNSDISAWDLSAVKWMEGLFYHASSFNGDLSQWDVSAVVNMQQLFRNAHAFNSDISSWDVSSVTNMQSLFESASSFNGDISSWDVAQVSNMLNMFYKAVSFNGDISAWDVSAAVNLSGMFQGAIAFNTAVGNWNVSSAQKMADMFNGAWSFNQDLNAWDVSGVQNTAGMFYSAWAFDGELGAWDMSKVTDLRFMFAEAHAFNKNIAMWDVSNATRMDAMFAGASEFNRDLSSWSVSNVSSMASMFKRAQSFDGDVSAWDVSAVTDMSEMFQQGGLSVGHYDALLNAWSVLPNLQSNVVLGADNINYTGAGQVGRSTLVDGYGWVIEDSGLLGEQFAHTVRPVGRDNL